MTETENETPQWLEKLFWTGTIAFNIGVWYNPAKKILKSIVNLNYDKYLRIIIQDGTKYVEKLHFSHKIALLGLTMMITAFVIRILLEAEIID